MLATIRSPVAASVVNTACIAAIPDENENAASVPSRLAMSSSNAPSVGFPYPRVYVYPGLRKLTVSA